MIDVYSDVVRVSDFPPMVWHGLYCSVLLGFSPILRISNTILIDLFHIPILPLLLLPPPPCPHGLVPGRFVDVGGDGGDMMDGTHGPLCVGGGGGRC